MQNSTKKGNKKAITNYLHTHHATQHGPANLIMIKMIIINITIAMIIIMIITMIITMIIFIITNAMIIIMIIIMVIIMIIIIVIITNLFRYLQPLQATLPSPPQRLHHDNHSAGGKYIKKKIKRIISPIS